MRTVKFELNQQAESLFDTLTKTPDFFGDTPRTLFVKLMMRASVQVLPKESVKSDTPKIGKVEQRHQQEKQEHADAKNNYFRELGIWPRFEAVYGDGDIRWAFPQKEADGTISWNHSGPWTPPEDFPAELLRSAVFDAEITQIASEYDTPPIKMPYKEPSPELLAQLAEVEADNEDGDKELITSDGE